MLLKLVPCFVATLSACAWANPLLLPPEHTPLSSELASELSSRVMDRASRLQDSVRDPRFPLPSAQDLEAIRRVAQVLIMLGEQVIPAIIGDPTGTSSTTTEIPFDPSSQELFEFLSLQRHGPSYRTVNPWNAKKFRL